MTAWDLTGRTFGKLHPIHRVADNVLPGGLHEPMWLCRCDCGNYIIVRGAFLRTGHTKSCGCARHQIRDLRGQTFNGIRPIKPLTKIKNQPIQWLCECHCGQFFITRGSSLTSGHTKSCGCLKRKQWLEYSRHLSKTERVLALYLKSSNIDFKQQVTFSDLINDRTGYNLTYDFQCFAKNDNSASLLIEIQGPQHYFPFWNDLTFAKFEQLYYRDQIKYHYAQNHDNLQLLEIPNPKYPDYAKMLSIVD